jgi:hypothetical protein
VTDFSAIFFMKGESRNTLNESMAYNLDQIWDKWSTEDGRPYTKPAEPELVNSAVLKWLQISRNKNWLLVFDSVDELDTTTLMEYIPSTNHGAVMVTTRTGQLGESMLGEGIGKLHRVEPTRSV